MKLNNRGFISPELFIVLMIIFALLSIMVGGILGGIKQTNYLEHAKFGNILGVEAIPKEDGEKQFHVTLVTVDDKEISFVSTDFDFVGSNGDCVMFSNGTELPYLETAPSPEVIANFGVQKYCFLIERAAKGISTYNGVARFRERIKSDEGIISHTGVISSITFSNNNGYEIEFKDENGESKLTSSDDSFAGTKGKCLKVMTIGDRSILLKNFGEIPPEECSSIASASNEEVVFSQTVVEIHPTEEKGDIANNIWSFEECSSRRDSLLKEQEAVDLRHSQKLETLFAKERVSNKDDSNQEALINNNCQGQKPVWSFDRCDSERNILKKKREQDSFQHSQELAGILEEKRTSDRINFKKEEQIDSKCQ